MPVAARGIGRFVVVRGVIVSEVRCKKGSDPCRRKKGRPCEASEADFIFLHQHQTISEPQTKRLSNPLILSLERFSFSILSTADR